METRPLIGRALDGAAVTTTGDRGAVGRPAWGPVALLRDLELRLGLPDHAVPAPLRVLAWSERLRAVLATAPFYAASYRVDPFGTAEMLLSWRDDLLDAGWDGTVVREGGARLATFAALEAVAEIPLPPGAADRLATVETWLGAIQRSPYPSLTFSDDRLSWPQRWRRVFAQLERQGTRLLTLAVEPPAAAPRSDLGRLQGLLRAGTTVDEPVRISRDGSLMMLRATTTLDAAQAVAAVIGAHRDGSLAVIRGGATAQLDDGLESAGIAPTGTRAGSLWRPPLLVLPLALRLLFFPPDVAAALELLGLTSGPFSAAARHTLSRALSDVPGIAGPRWEAAKQRLHEGDAALVEPWLEPKGDRGSGAVSKVQLLDAVARVADLHRRQQAMTATPQLDVAVEQSALFAQLLQRDQRDRYTPLAVRQLLDAVRLEASAELHRECTGRPDHVDHPGALLAPRDLVIWWHFVDAAAHTPHRARWRRAELDALAREGVEPLAPERFLDAESAQWRTAVLAAAERVLLVVPETDRGERLAPHPLWDEIVGQMRLTDAEVARTTVTTRSLLERPMWDVGVERLAPAFLPEPRPSWQIADGRVPAVAHLTPATLGELVECPLRWVLGQALAPRGSSFPALPQGPMLSGTLGHQLIQRLVEAGTLDAPRDEIERVIDALIPETAAALLQPGMAFELLQLRDQLVRTVAELVHVLRQGDLAPVACEEELDAPWLGVPIKGRLDLRLRGPGDREVILDLKWGTRTYRELLAAGRAVQLAVYAHLRQQVGGALPAAGYFSLSRGLLMTTEPEAFGAGSSIDGPRLPQTVAQLALTLPQVLRVLGQGHIPVTGVHRSLPLLESLAIPPDQHEDHYPAQPGGGCDYCRFAHLCGRAWETP